jgi:hypothetical protein
MTQTKTIKEKAVDEGINYLKDNDKIIYQDYDGFKVPDNLIREKDTLVAIKKAVDTYADEVKKVIEELEYIDFCPYCGCKLTVSDHYCDKCKERIVSSLNLSKEAINEWKKRFGLK